MNWSARARSKPFLTRSLYLLALASAIPLLAWNGFVQQVNAELTDLLFRLRGRVASEAVTGIVLLAIDDRTASRYGPLPLQRSSLADGLRKLASFSPKLVGVDLLLSEPTPQDGELAAALEGFPLVVLSAAMENDDAAGSRWILPLAPISRHASVAHVHAAPDADGIVRSVLLTKVSEGRRFWALGFEMARLALGAGRPLETRGFVQVGQVLVPARDDENRLMLINYAGPEGLFRRVSFAALLEGKVDAELFHNKIVVLGVTAQGSGDRLFTPFSSGIGMSGMEIHANVARTMLDHAFLLPMGVAGELLAYLVVAGVCVLGVGRLRGIKLLSTLALVALAIPVTCVLALRGNHLWPVGSLLAVFVAASGAAGVGEYALVTLTLRASEQKRKEYAFRVQAIAHEIKTPLTAIQGSSELIAEQLVPDRQRVEMAGLIYKESKRLTQLIHTFLDVERMASGSLPIQRQPTSVKALCDELLERARLYAARKKIQIQSEVPTIEIQGDPDLLSFAIYNLLTNAVKYSPKRTTITLGAFEQGGTVSISVADQGYGIAPEEQHRIFEKFYRLKRDERGEEEGSGIGLALVKEIVLQHGGRVIVESKPGAGSRFTLVLPKDGP